MKKISAFLFLLIVSVFIFGCEDDDSIKNPSKEGSIETVMNVNHLDHNHDIIITTHNVWIKNQLVKKIVHRDTVPTLGYGRQNVKNLDGNTKSVTLKKDFDIYITVK